MKTFLHQACILGGIYFILSEVLSRIPYSFVSYLDWMFLFVLIALLVMLAVKKSFGFLDKSIQKYSIIFNYVSALGVALYFSFFFCFIPGAIDGYLASQAGSANQVYISQFVNYLPIFTVLYRTVFWVSLVLATYLSFVKPWIYKKRNQ